MSGRAGARSAPVGGARGLLLVFAGGAVGSLARAGLSAVLGSLPGVFLANVAGSLVLGWLVRRLALRPGPRGEDLRLFAGTGVLGGFTTYSALATQAVGLAGGTGEVASGWGAAAALGAGSALLGVLAAGLGWWLAGRAR